MTDMILTPFAVVNEVSGCYSLRSKTQPYQLFSLTKLNLKVW